MKATTLDGSQERGKQGRLPLPKPWRPKMGRKKNALEGEDNEAPENEKLVYTDEIEDPFA